MTNEELQAKIESIKSFDDAYKMACEGGYTGTVQEFDALVKNAANEVMPMNLEDMENVAGGGLGDVWNSVTDACSTAANWVKNNPALTAEIVGGVAMVGVAVGTSVYAYKRAQTVKAYNAGKINIKINEADADRAQSLDEELYKPWNNAGGDYIYITHSYEPGLYDTLDAFEASGNTAW